MLDQLIQGRTRFDIKADGLTDARVTSFQHREHLNQPWVCDITLAVADTQLDLGGLIDQTATLVIREGHATALSPLSVRTIQGLMSEVEQSGSGRWWTEYSVRLEPPLARLEHRADSRIFQNMSVQAIIEAVLDDAGLTEREIKLQEAGQSPREYCVQYRETDLDFITRLCAEEGIVFAHASDNSMMLQMWDIGTTRPTAGPIEYNGQPSSWNADVINFIQSFSYRERVRPGGFKNRDYYFKKPAFRWDGSHDSTHSGMTSGGGNEAGLNIYDYSLRNKTTGGDPSSAVSKRRLEALRRDAAVGSASSTVPALAAGLRFGLTQFDNDALNRNYLIVGISHSGVQDQSLDESGGEGDTSYANSFMCVPDEIEWKDRFWVLGDQPLKPRVDGPQMATVVGPAGEEIYCDDYGRVKVQFPWDRYGKADENSSCWVRVSQLWAGAKYGGMAIPRIGHEVIVEHLDGDIDQPIITGRTYHETQRVPYDLPANKTRTVWKSDTHKGSGYNELRFEDEAGQEEIWIHGQKDRNEVIKNNRTKNVGNNQTEQVGANKTITVSGNHLETIAFNKNLSVAGNHVELIALNASVSTGLSRIETIGQNLTYQVGKSSSITSGEDIDIQAGKNSSMITNKDAEIKVNGDLQQAVMGERHETVGKKYTLSVANEFEITVGKSTLTMKSDGTIAINGKKLSVEGDSLVEIKSDEIKLN